MIMLRAEFSALYERYAGDVHRFAFWLSGNATDAEELTAETFARAWAIRDRIMVKTVKAYLLTITRNTHLKWPTEFGRLSTVWLALGRSGGAEMAKGGASVVSTYAVRRGSSRELQPACLRLRQRRASDPICFCPGQCGGAPRAVRTSE